MEAAEWLTTTHAPWLSCTHAHSERLWLMSLMLITPSGSAVLSCGKVEDDEDTAAAALDDDSFLSTIFVVSHPSSPSLTR